MKNLIYIILFVFSVQTNAQKSSEKKKFRIELLTYEKTSNDTISISIIEVYSGGKRIETSISGFDGISIFYINSEEVVDHKINLKIYGPKCSIFEKEYNLTDDLNTKINLEYGDTEYTHHNQRFKMHKKLNIELKYSEVECEYEKPTIIIKN